MGNSQIYERMVFFNSILLALFISVPCLNQLLITFNSGFESVMTILYVTIIVSIFICSRFTDKVKNELKQIEDKLWASADKMRGALIFLYTSAQPL